MVGADTSTLSILPSQVSRILANDVALCYTKFTLKLLPEHIYRETLSWGRELIVDILYSLSPLANALESWLRAAVGISVPKNIIAYAAVKMERRCSTCFALLVLEKASARFTNTPPRPWQIKMIGLLIAFDTSRVAYSSATSVSAWGKIRSEEPSPDEASLLCIHRSKFVPGEVAKGVDPVARTLDNQGQSKSRCGLLTGHGLQQYLW